ncbi:alpha/beta hydrolase [Nocardia sp. CA-135953]|uniref:alpha/beta hydrolase n=1 Tax=Nocardia sp. CA-135953 TaxID=3239978 RepID=UPI003D96F8B8
MALDTATSSFLAQMAGSGAPPTWTLTPQQARDKGGALIEMIGPGPDMAQIRDVRVDSDAGGTFEIRVLVPNAEPSAVLVYYHGGGWVVGHIDEFDTLARKLAVATGAAVVLVNYRKAPEHPHPVPIEDAWSALRWAQENLTWIAGRPVPLMVGGDSAGGNLAAVVALRARDRQGPQLALQILIYPVTDADLDTSSYRDPENQLMLDRKTMTWFWHHYLADTAARPGCEAAPLRAASLENLPPAIVLTAEHDVLRDEGEAYAERLAASGVQVRCHRFAGQMHGFFTFVNILPGSDAGIAFVAESVREIVGKEQAR